MQRFSFLTLFTMLASLSAAPILTAGTELPPCEPSLRYTEIAGPFTLNEDCYFEGEALASFTVKANGRTTNIVVKNVRAARGDRYRACLGDYARSLVSGFRFPKRDQACYHTMPLTFGTQD